MMSSRPAPERDYKTCSSGTVRIGESPAVAEPSPLRATDRPLLVGATLALDRCLDQFRELFLPFHVRVVAFSQRIRLPVQPFFGRADSVCFKRARWIDECEFQRFGSGLHDGVEFFC